MDIEDTYVFLCYLDLREGEKKTTEVLTTVCNQEESLARLFQSYKNHPAIRCSGSLSATVHPLDSKRHTKTETVKEYLLIYYLTVEGRKTYFLPTVLIEF